MADAVYWHTRQMESIVSDGHQVLVRPMPGNERRPTAVGRRSPTRSCAECFQGRPGTSSTSTAKTVEPVFAQNKFNRGFRRFQRRGRAAARSEWAAAGSYPQSAQASHRTGSAQRSPDRAPVRATLRSPIPSSVRRHHGTARADLCPTATMQLGSAAALGRRRPIAHRRGPVPTEGRDSLSRSG